MLAGDAGDNLLRRFRAQMHLKAGTEFTQLTIDLIRELFDTNLSPDDLRALHALEKWLLQTRQLAAVFNPAGPSTEVDILNLEFDVAGWYESDDTTPLSEYAGQASYRLFWDKKVIGDIIGQSQKMYTGDIEHNAARLIVDGSLRGLWRSYDSLPSG